MYRVIATGSTGNAVLYHDCILVDCGVPFEALRPFVDKIQLVLLTHEHKDHINMSTLRRLVMERPSLRIGCCADWFDTLQGRNIDRYQIGQMYHYGQFEICPVKLYHDVPNCGYRIFKDGHKTFHATDTAHLKGITAKDYDLFAIEHNYDEDTVYQSIAEKQAIGEYAHQIGSINSHLSEQQAREFIFNNRKPTSEVLRLHESRH